MAEDIDKLINHVRLNRPLWDLKDKRYHSRIIQRKLWMQLAEAIDSNVSDVKKRWKGLRDTFRREYMKCLKSELEPPNTYSSLWPFYEQLLFLANVMERKDIKGKLSTPVDYEILENDIEIKLEPAEESPEQISNKTDVCNWFEPRASSSTTERQETKNTQTRGKKRKRKIIEDKDIEKVEKIKVKKTAEKFNGILKNEKATGINKFSEEGSRKEDSEVQFLLSLLPFLRNVPQNRKLSVRNKLQQVFIDEEQYKTTENG